MTEKSKPDPERYTKLCEPFPDKETADKAVEAFYEEVEALRIKHRIPDVVIAFQAYVNTPEGEGIMQSAINFGNFANAEGILAFAYGREKRRREELMARLAAGKRG